MNEVGSLEEAALQRLQIGILVVDADLRILLANRWLLDAIAGAPADATGMALLTLLPALEGSRLLRAIRQALEQGLPSVLSPGLNPHPLPLLAPSSHGSERAAMAQAVQVIPLRHGQGRQCMVVVTDVSASMRREALLREQADKLNSLSLTDELTGIANRRRLNLHLEQTLQRAMHEQQPLSVIMFDIDHFKGYNDHCGHLAGDDCLTRISACLQPLTQGMDALLARYGGEEFCVVVAADARRALAIAEELRLQVERLALTHPANSASPWVTISLGVSCATPDQPDTVTGLLLKADRALYRAKQCGRNRSMGPLPAKG